MTESEFRKIVTSTKRAVLGAIRAHLSPDLVSSIDDVAQEAYMRMYKALSKGSMDGADEKALSSWAYVIARNECYRMNQKEKLVRRKVDASSDLFLLQQWKQDDQENAFFELDEMRMRISVLESPFKEVMSMLMDGYSLSEISDSMNVPEGTVKSRVFRARQKMKELYQSGAKQ
ncbi:MAG: RNA polymerase sigma factor [Leptospiraceae bacterium]|nr:RNA polymerase sigma factor [Leptospiraceae bacterium]MCB1305583.1 RNA polymerase sigma factor [Leptospiraceae bacterium]